MVYPASSLLPSLGEDQLEAVYNHASLKLCEELPSIPAGVVVSNALFVKEKIRLFTVEFTEKADLGLEGSGQGDPPTMQATKSKLGSLLAR